MLYVGIILIIFGFSTVFFSKDPLESATIKAKVKDKKGYTRFNGIMYIVWGILGLVFWIISFYVSNHDLAIPGMILCFIGALFQHKYGKRFF
jgi:uncharacterized membrane protein HdeD (DUF308 family)